MAVINGTTGNDSLVGTAENDVITGGAGIDTLRGLAGNDVLVGDDDADILDGGEGADTLTGGQGNDTYLIDNTADTVSEASGTGSGIDEVQTSISYTLGANVENLVGTGTGNITLAGNELQNNITGNSGANVLDGGFDTDATATELLTGGAGNDTYIIRGTGDTIVEAADDDLNGVIGGTDTALIVASTTFLNYGLAANQRVEVLQASDASSTLALNLAGNASAQQIVGNAGDNIITGNGGADTLVGLLGNDTYNVSTRSTVVTEADGGGADTVNITANDLPSSGLAGTFTFTGSIEAINASTATGLLNITGGATSQTITGNGSANLLNGGGGTDELIGGDGNDTYIVDSLDDVVTETSTGGTADRVDVTGSYQLRTNSFIEILAASGTDLSANVASSDGTRNANAFNTAVTSGYLVGNTEQSQTIYGSAGANILNGRTGNGLLADNTQGARDVLVGGAGNDTYRVYNQTNDATTSDVIVEDTNGGFDTVYVSGNFSIAQNDINARTVVLAGTGQNGGAYIGGTGVSQIEEVVVADATSTNRIDLEGNWLGQILVGNFGANLITSGGVSGTGIDQLSGLLGNDTYIVTGRQTTVNENAGEGIDTVNVNLAGTSDSFFSLINQAEVEFLTAGGSAAIDLQGSSFAQVITGNGASNTLIGGGGADTLIGGTGSDNYNVGSQDVQIVEAATTASDVEGAAAGTNFDRVFTTVSYDLANTTTYFVDAAARIAGTATVGSVQVEYLSAAAQGGTEALNLTGNGYAQTIVGNFGNNILNGDNDSLEGTAMVGGNFAGGGTNLAPLGDTLTGLFGDDIYRVYRQVDVIRETAGQGTDTAIVGFDTAFSTSNVDATNTYQLRAGNSIEVLTVANQSREVGYQLIGNELSQTNVLGSRADDVLWGGAGNDTLTGNGGNDVFGFNEAGTGNADFLADFNAGDRIGLASSAGAFFAGLGTDGVQSNELVNGTTAVGTNAQILFNQATGQIFYDADGTNAGAAQLIATITAGQALGFNDFTTIAAPPMTPAAG